MQELVAKMIREMETCLCERSLFRLSNREMIWLASINILEGKHWKGKKAN